jgi:hypothetical protein
MLRHRLSSLDVISMVDVEEEFPELKLVPHCPPMKLPIGGGGEPLSDNPGKTVFPPIPGNPDCGIC